MTKLTCRKGSQRRIYCYELQRYVTLTEIGDYWDHGAQVTIVSKYDGTDLTAASLLRLLAQRVESGLLEVSEARLRELGRVA